jgi:hypothetical protein
MKQAIPPIASAQRYAFSRGLVPGIYALRSIPAEALVEFIASSRRYTKDMQRLSPLHWNAPLCER